MQEVTPRRVMIVEGNPDGHRLYYVSLLIRSAIGAGFGVTVATSEEALASAEWSTHMGGNGHDVTVTLLNDYALESLRKLADKTNVDHVVVPDGDSIVYELAKGSPWSQHKTITALVMREKAQPSAIRVLRPLRTLTKQALFLVANLRSRVEVRILKSGPWRGFSAVPIIRDPVTLTNPGPERIDLPEGPTFWFGIVGRVGHRKNVPLVAAALASLNRSDIGLVLAGRMDDGVLDSSLPHLDRIRDNGGRVVIIDRQLSESEMDQLIVDVHCLVLAHSNEGPSGILGKAVAAGTRIVAAGALTLRSDCRRIGPSAEWVRMSEHRLAGALGRAISGAPPRPVHLSSPEEFAAGLLGTRP